MKGGRVACARRLTRAQSGHRTRSAGPGRRWRLAVPQRLVRPRRRLLRPHPGAGPGGRRGPDRAAGRRSSVAGRAGAGDRCRHRPVALPLAAAAVGSSASTCPPGCSAGCARRTRPHRPGRRGDATGCRSPAGTFGAAVACHVLHLVADWVAWSPSWPRPASGRRDAGHPRSGPRPGVMAEVVRRIRASRGAAGGRAPAVWTSSTTWTPTSPPRRRRSSTCRRWSGPAVDGAAPPHRRRLPGRPRRASTRGPGTCPPTGSRLRSRRFGSGWRTSTATRPGCGAVPGHPLAPLRAHARSVGVTAAPGGRQGGRAGGRHSPRGDGSGAAACALARDRSAWSPRSCSAPSWSRW